MIISAWWQKIGDRTS